MKPLFAKQIEDEDTEGHPNDPQNPLDPNSGGVPGTPKQAPDGD